MRELVLDTETTGLDPAQGHRVLEVACVELWNHVVTGRAFHRYINPEREVPQEAYNVHGLGWDFLAQYPRFVEIAPEMLTFIGGDPLVIHNAEFDMRFLNHELGLARHSQLAGDNVVDTLALARQRFPGAQVNLDALCKRFAIDNTQRDWHGALLDCQLLAEVYLELRGGRQPGLVLTDTPGGSSERVEIAQRERREPRPHAPSEAERAAHAGMCVTLKNPLWSQ